MAAALCQQAHLPDSALSPRVKQKKTLLNDRAGASRQCTCTYEQLPNAEARCCSHFAASRSIPHSHCRCFADMDTAMSAKVSLLIQPLSTAKVFSIDGSAHKTLRGDEVINSLQSVSAKLNKRSQEIILLALSTSKKLEKAKSLLREYEEYKDILVSEIDKKLDFDYLFENMIDSEIEKIREFYGREIEDKFYFENNINWRIIRNLENDRTSLGFSVADRLKKLEDFAIANSGQGVAELARVLFPELKDERQTSASPSSAKENHVSPIASYAPLPSTAPALWSQDREAVHDPGTSKKRLENAGEFTRRVYGPWLGKGMTRNLLRKLDNPLFQALYRAYGSNLPDDLPLPTKKDENDRWVARVEEEGLAAVIPEGASPEFVLKEASRLAGARHRRRRD